MKVKSLFLTAFVAAMAFTSCSNEEGGFTGDGANAPKQVTITLPNVQPAGSKAVGDAIANGTAVALNNFKVFFVDASDNVVTIPQYNGKDQQAYFDAATTTSLPTAATYHFIPATAVKAVVVGNLGDKDFTAVKALNNQPVLNDSKGHPTYQLYGDADLTKGGVHNPDTHVNVYQATINLTPLQARLEIYGFGYEKAVDPALNKYNSIKVQKIALNNYYTAYNFYPTVGQSAGAPAGTITKAVINDTNAWDWINAATAPWADDLTLTLAPGETKNPDGTAFVTGGETAKNIITYGLAVGSYVPNLVVSMLGVKDANETPLYLNATSYSGGLTQVEAGKIYRVNFTFGDEDFKQPERCVELKVTVANWQVVPVTPNFGK